MHIKFGTKLKFKKNWEIGFITMEKDDIVDVALIDDKYGMKLHHKKLRNLIDFKYDWSNKDARINEWFEIVVEEPKHEKVNPILGNGKYKVISCGGENKERGKFYALAILPNLDGIAREIGEYLPESELIQSINDDTDIAIYFTNIESIDVVIDRLEKVKEYIREDNKSQNKCDTCEYIFATCKGDGQVFGGKFNDEVLECEYYLLDNKKGDNQ